MSKQIENNVVQMTFDNKQFENGINESSKSIEKLNEQLKFKDASDGFKDIEKYANSVNFDGLNKAINNINSVFTITGNLTKKIIDDIAGYFEQKIARAVSSVTNIASSIMSPDLGWAKYKDYTTTMLTMSSNLSDYDQKFFEKHSSEYESKLDYVESYISKLALYADETSYSLTDMADTMAKFAASNVDLEKSSSAMMGFANMAAVAGQNSQVATSAMIQLAQAFGTGYIKYQDWQQAFSLKNIATKESKQIFIDAAKEMGTIDDKDIAQAKKVLGDNWMNWFFTSEQLNEGWLKTDTVLVKGLQEYSKASDLILNRMEEIGDVSVTDILSWTEEFQESGKSVEEFAQTIAKTSGSGVKDVSVLTEVLKKLSSAEYELSLKAFRASQMATNFSEAIDAVKDAVGTKFLYAFKYLIGDLDQARKLWTSFANSLWDVFASPLDNALEGLRAWNKGLIEVGDTTEVIEENYTMFWESVGSFFTNIGSIFNGLIDQFRILAGCFEYTEAGFETTSIIATYTLSFMRKVTTGMKSLADAVGDFLESEFYSNVKTIFMNIIKIVRNVKKITGALFNATVGNILKNIGGPLTAISDILVEISKRIEMYTSRILTSEAFNRFIEILTKITTKLMELGTYLIGQFGNILIKIVDKVWELATKLAKFLMPAIEGIFKFVESYILPAIDGLIDGPYSISAAIDCLAGAIGNIIPLIKSFVESITGMSFDEVAAGFDAFVGSFVDKVKEVGKAGFGVLGEFLKDTFNRDVKGSIADFFGIIEEADSIAEGAEGVIRWSGDALSRPIQMIFNLLQVITGIDLSKVADAITSFIKTVANTLGDISPTIFKGVEIVFGIIIKVLTAVGSVVVEIIKYLGGVTDTTGFKVLDKVLDGLKQIFTLAIDLFVYLLSGLGNVVTYITPGIEKALDYLVILATYLADALKKMFSNFEGLKDPQRLVSQAVKLLGLVAVILIIAKIIDFIGNIVYQFGAFQQSTRLLSKSVYALSDGISSLLYTLSGDSFTGVLRTLALMMISIGYALSSLAKAGEILSNKDALKGTIAGFAMMVILMYIIVSAIKAVTTAQVTMYKAIEQSKEKTFKAQEKLKKLQKKHGKAAGYWGLSKSERKALALDPSSLEKQKVEMQETLKGVGSFLLGMGVAIAGISLSIALLAKVSKSTSQGDLYAAATSIAIIILFLALAAKLAKGIGDSEKIINKNDGIKIKNSGSTYKGLAAALLAFSAAIIMISVPLAMLAVVAKLVGAGDMILAIIAIGGILAGLTFMIKQITKYNLNFGKVIGLVLIINTLALSIVAIAGALAVLTVCIKLLNTHEEGTLFKMGAIMAILFAGIVAILMVMSKNSSKINPLQMAKQVSSMIGIASIVITLIGAVALVVSILSVMAKIGDVTAGTNALIKIGIVVAVLMAVFMGLTKIVSTEKISAIFKLALTMSLLIVAISSVVLIIGVAGVITKILDTSSLNAGVVLLLKAFGLLAVMIVGMVLMTKTFSSSVSMIGKILALLPIVVIALTALTWVIGDIILLALAVKLMGNDTKAINVAIAALVKVILAIAGLMAVIVIASKFFDINVKVLKMVASLVAIIAAISLLSMTLIALSAAIKLLGLEGSVGKALLILGGALIGLVVAVTLLGLVAKVAGPPLGMLAKSLGIIMLVVLATIAVVFLFIACGDKLVTWLETNSEMIKRTFFAIGKALADMFAGFLLGVNETLPQLLEALANTIAIILNWIKSHIAEWANTLVGIIAELLVGIGEGIEANKSVIAEGITKIILGLWHVITQVMANFSDMFEKQLEEWFGDPQEELNKKMEDSERKHQEEMYNIRQKGAEAYIKLIENVEEAEEALHKVVQEYGKIDEHGNITNTADIARAQANLNAAKNEIEQKQSYRWDWYDVDPNKSAEENKKSSKYLQEYDEEWDYRNNKAKDSAKKAGLEVGKAYGEGVIDGVAESQGTHSPSEDGNWLGKMLSLGFLNGANAEGTGNSIGANIINGFKDKLSGAKEVLMGLFGGDMNISGIGTDAGEALGGNMLSGYNDAISNMDFTNVGNGYLTQDAYHLDNYDLWDQQVEPELDYQANLNTTVTDDQLGMVSNAVDNGNEAVVNAINELRDKFDTMVNALNNAKVVMDTGSTVGALVVPMDKALGEISAKKERRY